MAGSEKELGREWTAEDEWKGEERKKKGKRREKINENAGR